MAVFVENFIVGGTEMTDEDFMRRAIELAKRGEGWCHPNPLVGAVIVKDGKIIGEGYHHRCGELHAERNAIASLRESAEGATIYVTLEPCCHYGRTPPCTEAIIENKIARVVIGSRDPNPKVHGKGAAQLRSAGIRVEEDFLKDECDRINPIFFSYITTHEPYVIMKFAETADGKIATKTGASKWISGEESREVVQQLRHRCMAIMVGIGTVLADDPHLNCRIEGGRDPVRVICDSHLRTPLDSVIVKTAREQRTIIACAEDADAEQEKLLASAGVDIWRMSSKDGGVDLRELMKRFGENEIDSVLLEGGASLNASALNAGIVNEADIFIAPKIFGGTAPGPVKGEGVSLPDEAWKLRPIDAKAVGDDWLLRYQVIRSGDDKNGNTRNTDDDSTGHQN
jgi:diaminohydroxyphosphoribosylaminopyrimidine deaminase/5-amino-6-(5-phosphoribosylamino)uracil reductase